MNEDHTSLDRRRALSRLSAATALALSPTAALWSEAAMADEVSAFPSKPVKLIVPFSPGGPTDTIARLTAERLQALWKQPVIIDYKPGGGTILGTDFIAKSAPDGYTLGMAISALMVNPALGVKLPYDPRKDVTGVSEIAVSHFALFAHPSMPFNTVPELIAYAKAHPGELSFASPGNGTGTHLAGEMLNFMAGIDMVHIPYKGSAPAQQDVIGGRVPLLFDVMFSGLPFVKDNRLKIIGLSSPKRASSNPEIPLIADTVPGFSAMSIIGIIAPGTTPPALINKISADIASVMKSPALTERMLALGTESVGSTPKVYNDVIRSEIDKWTKVVKAANIHLE
jgi:tripartite-type tricarboxylate transporter receptor subunit TctC